MLQMEQYLQQRSGSEMSPDLDLIEVLWRQDVDLGVGKEVFDPNLRKEIEQERELELRKEQERRKEAERRERERQQQAEQWLSQNFIRDGETGELMPIAGGNNGYSSSASSGYNAASGHSEGQFPATLEEALNFLGELQSNHTYGKQAAQPPHPQPAQQTVAAGGAHSSQHLLPPYDADSLHLLPHNPFDEASGGHSYTTTTGPTHEELLEQRWKEVLDELMPPDNTAPLHPAPTTSPSSTTTTATATITAPQSNILLLDNTTTTTAANNTNNNNNYTTATNSTTNSTANGHGMLAPLVENPEALGSNLASDTSFLGDLLLLGGVAPPPATTVTSGSAPNPNPNPNPNPSNTTGANSSLSFLLSELSGSSLSQSASMSYTRQLLHQTEVGDLAGLLSNASLPIPPPLSTMDEQPLLGANDTDMLSSNYTPGASHHHPHHQPHHLPPHSQPPSILGDLETEDLLFCGPDDLSNLTGSMLTSPGDLLSTNLLDSILPIDDMDMDQDLDGIQMLDETGSDSAISMGSGSPQQEINETMQMSPFEGLEGATGGSDYDNGTGATYSSHHNHHNHRSHMHSSSSAEEDSYQHSCSSYGSPASVSTNYSSGSNDTEHSSGPPPPSLHHIHHNHSYPTQPGQTPREVKKYAKKDGPRQKGPQSRDNKRAHDLKLPYSFEQIVGTPVEEFNELLTKTKLTEAQVNLMRDIRRRGKNKVAAQNCRKRKLDVLVTLEEEMEDMQRTRDKLAEERHQIERLRRQAKDRYSALYAHIFSALRDDHGQPYDPALFSLQQSGDGNVYLIRKVSGSATSTVTSSSSSSSSPTSPTSTASTTTSSASSSAAAASTVPPLGSHVQGLSSSSSSSSSLSGSSNSGSKRRGKNSDSQKDSSFPPQKKKIRE